MSKLDDLIDRAAGDLTRGEPSPQLRRAVRARIGRSRAVFGLEWWVPALAGAAVVVLALFAGWHGTQTPPAQPIAVALPNPPRALPEVPPREQVQIEAAGARSARAVPRQDATRDPEPLDPIDPLAIDRIVVPQMAIGDSSVPMPIQIDDLRIEPLQIE